jgi:site-specific DNA recombinase
VSAITLGRTQLSITLDAATVACAAGLDASQFQASLCEFTTKFTQKRRGVELRIVAGTHNPAPDQTLIRALRNAHDWAGKLKAGKPLREIADHAGYTDRYIRRVISLISLSPRIQTAILDGTQPTELNLETLVRGNVPLDWNHQYRLFGMTD